MWEGIINKMHGRVKKWSYRTLNLAGQLILTKAILQAILAYLMRVFPAPKGILQKIRAIQRNFLWRGAEDKKKWAMVAWNKLCRPKNKRGLGLQDPQVTNDAYGAKLWWRWVKDNLVPWAKLWKEKYAPGVNPQEKIRFTGTGEGSAI